LREPTGKTLAAAGQLRKKRLTPSRFCFRKKEQKGTDTNSGYGVQKYPAGERCHISGVGEPVEKKLKASRLSYLKAKPRREKIELWGGSKGFGWKNP